MALAVSVPTLILSIAKFIDKHSGAAHSNYGYGIGFDAHSVFSLSSGDEFGKNIIMFGVHNSSYAHADNRKKHILILGKGSTDGLVDTTITAEAVISIV